MLVERKAQFDYIIIETSGMADPGAYVVVACMRVLCHLDTSLAQCLLTHQSHSLHLSGPVASCLWVDEALESQLFLDGIVTVVDAKHIARHIGHRLAGGEQQGALLALGVCVCAFK